MGAADCADKKSPPPLELEYAWQGIEHPGALPLSGGLKDQPVALMKRMRACYNVWNAFNEYITSGQSVDWTSKNHDKWMLVTSIMELRIKRERGEI